MDKIIVICGPTAVGKTKLSISLAKSLNGEIINADSTQIYKDMNIGTAKITEDEKEGIPHHLFDVREISDIYTVYDYQKDCRKIIDEIKDRGKTPILVGGTGLYIKAALYNYEFNEEEIMYSYDEFTNEELYKQLLEIDPETIVHPNNRKRIERALTYYKNNNVPISSNEKSDKLLYGTIFIGLTAEREILYEKINNRTDKMIENGLIDEAKKLYNLKIVPRALLTPICYKELFLHFDGNITLAEAIELIKQRSRKYAKRQFTFFKNQLDIKWYEVDFEDFSNTIDKIKDEI
jgi:tRNA dimethylallyltransferase